MTGDRSLASLLFVAALVTAAPTRAADWHLQAEALTDVPIQVGGRVAVEGPWRLRLTTTFGVLPPPYVDLVNAVGEQFDGYTSVTSALVGAALESSFVWRLHVGWRWFDDLGFYAEVGYGLATLGGGLSSEELLTAATDGAGEASNAGREYAIDATLHMLDAEVGYEWVFWDQLVARVGLGVAATLGSRTEVSPQFQPLAPRFVDALTAEAEAYLDDIFTTYVITPTVSVAVGYRFF